MYTYILCRWTIACTGPILWQLCECIQHNMYMYKYALHYVSEMGHFICALENGANLRKCTNFWMPRGATLLMLKLNFFKGSQNNMYKCKNH